jgi:hypothetical protein
MQVLQCQTCDEYVPVPAGRPAHPPTCPTCRLPVDQRQPRDNDEFDLSAESTPQRRRRP